MFFCTQNYSSFVSSVYQSSLLWLAIRYLWWPGKNHCKILRHRVLPRISHMFPGSSVSHPYDPPNSSMSFHSTWEPDWHLLVCPAQVLCLVPWFLVTANLSWFPNPISAPDHGCSSPLLLPHCVEMDMKKIKKKSTLLREREKYKNTVLWCLTRSLFVTISCAANNCWETRVVYFLFASKEPLQDPVV